MMDVTKTQAFREILHRIEAYKLCHDRYIQDTLAHGRSPDPARMRMLIALDGRCGAGKTTMADALSREFNRQTSERPVCTVFHMDDYFLRPEQRTSERLATPGGNVDHERFRAEILEPLRAGRSVTYRPFDCATQTLREPITVHPGLIALVEGSYACHPALRALYDLRLFLTVSPDVQWERILRRNGEAGAQAFRTRWIPLEERYIAACGPEDACDGIFTLN